RDSWGRAAPPARRDALLEAAREHRHFLRGLLVAFLLGHLDSPAIRRKGLLFTPALRERLPEQLPGCGIPGVFLDRCPELRGCRLGVAALQVFGAERKAQQRAVPGRAHELQEIRDLL